MCDLTQERVPMHTFLSKRKVKGEKKEKKIRFFSETNFESFSNWMDEGSFIYSFFFGRESTFYIFQLKSVSFSFSCLDRNCQIHQQFEYRSK